MLIVGQGALARPDGAAVLALAAKAAMAIGGIKPELGWNGFNVLHTAAARVGGLDLGFVPGKGGRDVDAMLDGAEKGDDRCRLPARRRRDRHGAIGDRLRHLSGKPRRRRRPSRRCHPSRRRLYREGRDLRQHRRPPADDRARRRSRRARRARTGRSSGPCPAFSARRCPSTACRSSAPRCSPSVRIWRCSTRSFPPTLPPSRSSPARPANPGKERFETTITDFYLTNPIARASAIMASLSALHAAKTTRRPAPMAEFWSSYGLPFALIVAQSLALLVVLLIIVAFLLYADRKVWAAVQMRRGPNVVGPFGLLQSFADLLKFVFKEPIIPAGANKGIFLLAPLITAGLALSAWAVIPVAEGWAVADINVGILYIFAISSLAGLRRDHGRLGVELEIRLPRRAPLGGADGLLRGLDRLRHHHRAAVRRLAQSERDRRGARQPPSACSAGTGCRFCRCSSCSSSRRWPRPTGRPSICSKPSPSSSRASWSNTPRRPTCCSCWASMSPSC